MVRWLRINDWYGTGWAQIEPSTGRGAYIIAGGLSQNISEQRIAYGGSGTMAMNITASAEKMGSAGAYVYNWLKKQNITKDDAAMEAAIVLAEFFVGFGISLVVAPLIPITVNLMLLIVPATLLFGPGIPLGVLIGLSPYPRVGIALSGMSLIMAIHYAMLALDPNGRVYFGGYVGKYQ